MEHIETKYIHNYAINLNNWSNKKPIQCIKSKA